MWPVWMCRRVWSFVEYGWIAGGWFMHCTMLKPGSGFWVCIIAPPYDYEDLANLAALVDE